ncbi:two-component system response regulator [Micromonospora sp. ATCC 39149]|uniref:Winged helix-turn-helix transcriptional regulator n=1 Tax=Micromonospora carbonacea TaxID=47853 RepID=A0A7D6C745_9ACTN|nr:winged helix-turn-helix domain-containing protein [Micromonospora sp. ATCC 39149]EEP73697.1 two-component system response regulator [Micromonospora sp. ATCC 39149]QLJ99606.1 winged helix-turn-helix transcriptional regulator [Micromonospora carbonacea]
MEVAEASGEVRTHGVEARQSGDVLTVTVQLRFGPAARAGDLGRLDALLALLGGDPVSMSPPEEPDRHLRIDPQARAVYCGRTEVALTRREYDLLLYLAEHPRQAFTRRQLLQHVWEQSRTSPRSVDVHVRRLRAKFGADVPVVTTLRGVGYRLGVDCAVEIVDALA